MLIAVLSKKHLLLLNESERVNMLTHWVEKAYNSPRLGAKTLDIMTLSITTVSISKNCIKTIVITISRIVYLLLRNSAL